MAILPVPVSLGEIAAARLAIFVAFFNLGIGGGLWAVFIPVVASRLGIGEGVIGLVLLSLAVGAIIAMPATGWAIARYGSHVISAIAAATLPLAVALPILAPTLPLLFVAAILTGAAMGVLDVAMNNEAARVEVARGRPSMSAFHAFFSLGGLAGAGLGALLVSLGPSAGWAAAGALVLLAIWASLFRGWYLPAGSRPAAAVKFSLPSQQLLGIGLLAFLSFGLEGAIGDWSALFLTEDRHAGPVAAAAGFAAFSAAMATMRLLGDRLVARIGRSQALTIGGSLIVAGCSVALLAPWPALSAAGFGLVGIGAANIVPVLFTTAARFPASGGVSAVSTIGYIGVLLWPPVIGGIADFAGLPVSLWLIAVAGLILATSGRLVRVDVARA